MVQTTGPSPPADSGNSVSDDGESTLSSKAVKDELLVWLPNLRAFAISLCGSADRADDLVQEALLKAWKHLDTFQEGTNLRAWLFTILRNTFLSNLRSRRDDVSLDADPDYAGRVKIAPEQYGRLDGLDMQRALNELTPEQRAAIILVGAEGFSYEETAEICGCKVGTIKSRVNRARTRLLELLGEDEPRPKAALQTPTAVLPSKSTQPARDLAVAELP
jgi:RNA polymerase sigma-70 factor, ECF subfamily